MATSTYGPWGAFHVWQIHFGVDPGKSWIWIRLCFGDLANPSGKADGCKNIGWHWLSLSIVTILPCWISLPQSNCSVGCCNIFGPSHVASSDGKSFHWMRYSDSTLVLNFLSCVAKMCLGITITFSCSIRPPSLSTRYDGHYAVVPLWAASGYTVILLYTTCPTVAKTL